MVGKRKKFASFARSGRAAVISPFRRANNAIGDPKPSDYPEHSLLGLPGELRNILYEYIFHPEDTEDYLNELQTNPYVISSRSSHGGNGITFLRTCRLIYHECRTLAYSRLVANLSPFSQQNPYAFDVQKAIEARGLKIRPPVELIRRITVQQFLFFGIYPWWRLEKSGIEPEELIIQICLCNKVEQLYSQPRKCREVCDTIEQAAKDIKSLKRIVVYYCGLEWPLWLCQERDVHFPSIVASCESQQGTKIETIPEDEEESEEDDDEDDLPVRINSISIASSHSSNLEHDEESQPSRYRIVGDWYKSHCPNKNVIVDFIDSMTLCGKECVRDRTQPFNPSNAPPSIQSSRSTRSASYQRL